MQSILPLLLVLVCPVMMVLMMRGMHRAHGREATPAQMGIHHANDQADITALREQNDDLEARVQELEYQLGKLQQTRETQLTGV